MLNKLLPLFLIVFQSDLTAQFVLIDSIEFDPKTRNYVIDDKRSGDAPLALTLGLIETSMPSDSVNEVHIKNRYKINLPHGSQLLYIDKKQLILSQLASGNQDSDESGKYREDRKTFSKYTIDSAGTLTLVKSVGIRMEDLPVGYDYALPSNPIIITAPLAVASGSCNSGYSIYDDNLELQAVIKPDLPATCGINSRVFRGNDRIQFVDQDPSQKNIFSWCTANEQLTAIHCRRIIITDSLFRPFNAYVVDSTLYISGWKKAGTGTEFPILVYSYNGVLLNTVITDGLLVYDVNKIGNDIMYFGSRPDRHEVVVLDESYKQKHKFKTSYKTTLLQDKILTYNNNKVFIYKLK